MLTRIAKIVKSNSHVDYVGRVIDRLDVDEPPVASEYGFAQFVSISIAESEVIGVIYDTQLLNPEYGNFGPRLSPPADLSVLSPDYLNEQGVLIGILLLGWRAASSIDSPNSPRPAHHAVPRHVVPVGCDVYCLNEDATEHFHRDASGRLQLHYYSQVVAHAKLFAVPLIEAIIERLSNACTQQERQQLQVLKKSLAWQRTFGGMRL